MNFLSHFYFDQQQEDSHFIVGVALPDLIKNHNRRWNIHFDKKTHKFKDNNILQSLENGWRKHLEVDYYFHESDYFKQNTTFIRKALQEISFETQGIRTFLLAHIGLELILDTLLIQHQQINVRHFYQHLANISHNDITLFLAYNNIDTPSSFVSFYQQFNNAKYLFSYQDNESIVYALNRINARILGLPFSQNDINNLNKLFSQLLEHIRKDYIYIFDEISKKVEPNG